MGLTQLNFEGSNKIEVTLERLRNFEPAEGYYMAFSGGKDSITLYRLAEMAGVKFDAHYHVTNVDPPELVQFIKRQYAKVSCDLPPLSMWELVLHHKFPPLRQQRYCCQELKEQGGQGRVVLTGIRWAESPRRKIRHLTETCLKDGNKTFVNPIIDWTDEDVWGFIRQEQIDYCSLYDEGWKRLGCICCPMSGYENARRDIVRWPKIAAQWGRIFDRVIDIRRAEGKRCTFDTGEEMFDWWIHRMRGRKESQPVLFD